MVVVTFRLALRVIDFAFVLHMKNVTGSLFQGTNSKELRALVRAYSKKEKEVDHLDDAESGKKKSGSCFGKARKPKNVYDPSDRKINDYSDVKLDPEQEKKFEQRAMHFIKVRADLERERAHLKKEIEHAMKSQTHRRKEVLAEKREVKAQKNQGNALSILKTAPAQSERTKTGGGSPLPSPRSRPTESDASPAAQAALDRFDENPKKSKALGILQKAPSMADRGVVHTGGTTAGAPQSPSATSPGAITPAAQAVLKRFESPSGMDAGMDAIVTPGKVCRRRGAALLNPTRPPRRKPRSTASTRTRRKARRLVFCRKRPPWRIVELCILAVLPLVRLNLPPLRHPAQSPPRRKRCSSASNHRVGWTLGWMLSSRLAR